MAGQIDVTGDPRDIEDLIGENKKQAATLDSIADETTEMELIEEMAVLKVKLTVLSKKLRQQRDGMLDQGMPKPSFSQGTSEAMPKSSSSHWYSDQSPSGGWADEVEEEEKSHGRKYQPQGRPAGMSIWSLRRMSHSSGVPTGTRSCKCWTSWPTGWIGLQDQLPLPGLSSRISIRTSPSGGRILCRI